MSGIIPYPSDPVSILLANWIAPMDGPLVAHAGVAFSKGKILSIGSARDVQAAFPEAAIDDLGQSILLPGLINAHVHLELSALSPGERPASFVDWLKRLLPRTAPDPEALRAFVQRGVDIGVRQCLQFGVTTVGDISRQCALTRPQLKDGPLRVTSFGEVQAMAQRRGFLDERIAIASDRSQESGRLRVGISPHAPYSVELDGYRRCVSTARSAGIPIATHLAETREEAPFLANHAGDFRELWRYLDAWDEQVPTFIGGPIRFAREVGLLDLPSLLAHVNYCDNDELGILAKGQASVVYCPRTHAYFGHPPHRLREMLSAGINVAVGTDSCASSPNLNLVDDLRLIRTIAPDMPAMEIWELATVRGAKAIGRQNDVGTLAVDRAADFVAFPVTGIDPLEQVLSQTMMPSGVWIDGRKM